MSKDDFTPDSPLKWLKAQKDFATLGADNEMKKAWDNAVVASVQKIKALNFEILLTELKELRTALKESLEQIELLRFHEAERKELQDQHFFQEQQQQLSKLILQLKEQIQLLENQLSTLRKQHEEMRTLLVDISSKINVVEARIEQIKNQARHIYENIFTKFLADVHTLPTMAIAIQSLSLPQGKFSNVTNTEINFDISHIVGMMRQEFQANPFYEAGDMEKVVREVLHNRLLEHFSELGSSDAAHHVETVKKSSAYRTAVHGCVNLVDNITSGSRAQFSALHAERDQLTSQLEVLKAQYIEVKSSVAKIEDMIKENESLLDSFKSFEKSPTKRREEARQFNDLTEKTGNNSRSKESLVQASRRTNVSESPSEPPPSPTLGRRR